MLTRDIFDCGQGRAVVPPSGARCRPGARSFPVLNAAATGIMLVVLLFPGCGGSSDGPPRFRVSGTVTYDGQPVHMGRITFTPDSQKGNTGPAGYADIRNGRFDTGQDGQGVVGGPHVVMIQGYSSEVIVEYHEDADAEIERPKPLFDRYEEQMDLETAHSQISIEVPVSVANGK